MMRRAIILIMICTLINGCGLFKKTSKEVEKHQSSTKIEQREESTKESKEQTNEQSSKQSEEQTNERENRDIDSQTTLEADKITIDENGNISAIGNAKLNSKLKDKSQKETNTNKAVQEDSSKQTVIDIKESNKVVESQESVQKDYSKTTKSETDFFGIIAGGLVALLVVAGLLWYFKIGRR